MNAVDAIILGVVQGVTEFLPVSSSGHLILAREVLGIQTGDGLAVDAVLQLVTALAVLLYFHKDFWTLVCGVWDMVRGRVVEKTTKILMGALLLGTIPAVLAGLFLEQYMETLFRNPILVAWVLIAGSGLFLVAEYVQKRIAEDKPLTVVRGLYIGLFQCLALVPGMSRSGATISGAMIMGLRREHAARFAFLLSVPIILGAGSKKLLELSAVAVPTHEWYMIALASVTAFASGLASIHYLLKYLKSHSLVVFVLYRVALAVLVFVLLT